MKIHRVQPNKNGIKLSFRIFWNTYYLLMFCGVILLFFIGATVVVLIVNLIDPKTLKGLDKEATLELFEQLQESNRHHEAIALMEYKGGIISGSPEEIDPEEIYYITRLADSYIHIGDYSKAERMLLDVWERAPQYIEKIDDADNAEQIRCFLNMFLARSIYQLYANMGDKQNQIKFYRIYKSQYDQGKDEIDSFILEHPEMFQSNISAENLKEVVEYDSIVVSYEYDKPAAISGMGGYIDKIIGSREYGPAYKVTCLNKLIKWLLDDGELIDAYPRIAEAVEQVKKMRSIDDYSVLGELCDYCYDVHDIELSKSLYKRYQKYLDKKYRKDDLEYLNNYGRRFRYLEEENKWDKLSSEVVDYCKGMRKQIALNIPTMSEEQRELFAKQFDVAHSYSMRLLQKHPTDELASLCFDNTTFRSGLLLRSNLSLKHSIESLGDSLTLVQYNRLDSLRRELIFVSVTDKANLNFLRKNKLKTEIEETEKTLALKSVDYRHKTDLTECTYGDIRKKINGNEAVVEIVENEGNIFALVLKKNNSAVQYIPIGNMEDIQDKLHNHIYEIYNDSVLTSYLWSSIDNIVKDCSTIYYMPIGQMNQIAMGALFVGDNTYLCDVKRWQLISNPYSIIEGASSPSRISHLNTVALWGGINYGGITTAESPKEMRRGAIKRGEKLENLRYAYEEVLCIGTMLANNGIKKVTYTKDVATEESFKARSGMKDYIIHISTHGFFNDMQDTENAMLQSGLFFAGANAYWCNDSTSIDPNKDDGILRAAEISVMDLSGCSLAVLSACETGLGVTDVSEGVYGLQRAFKLAGADMVLMSLWDVDDRPTTLLMTEFYKHLLDGLDADEALRRSQVIVRQEYPSPEYWGGFVLLH